MIFKGILLRCSTSFRIIGNTNCNYYEKTFFSPVWQAPRSLKTECVGKSVVPSYISGTNGKRYDLYSIHIADSLCCTAETNTTL